jgi:hypothetical protein
VLHDAFDFRIESIQTGFPDCVARRSINKNRWEELRIEFEFKSREFLKHKHDPELVDVIVCWEHNWSDCPKDIEVIELSSLINNVESISEDVKEPKKLSAYNKFCQKKRLEGLSFPEIASLWNKQKPEVIELSSLINNVESISEDVKEPKKLSAYNKFCQKKRLEGLSFSEIASLWKKQKTLD